MFGKIISVIVLSILCIFLVLHKEDKNQNNSKPSPEIKTPNTPNIGDYISGYQSYDEICSMLKEWESKAEDLVDVGVYGKTTGQKDHNYLKISNEYCPGDKKVLITACIHGNEPLSTSTVLAYAGMLISHYGKDKEITDIINTTTIYIIPVVSPDSYPDSRSVNGVDPNRDFPTLGKPNKESVVPIKNLQDFFLKIKPNSVLSGHTFGRVYLIPWGDSKNDNPNIEEYERVAKNMCDLSGYRYQRACEMYNKPIYGTEIDWYHRNGAFAMVMEFGFHQKRPSINDTKEEFNKTINAILFFIKESTNINIKNSF